MSHGGYGNRRGRRGGGRGYGDGNRERWDRGAGSSDRGPGHSRSSEWESREDRGGRGGGGGGGRGRPPPHLKGREIGLWYAKWGGIKRKEQERTSVSTSTITSEQAMWLCLSCQPYRPLTNATASFASSSCLALILTVCRTSPANLANCNRCLALA